MAKNMFLCVLVKLISVMEDFCFHPTLTSPVSRYHPLLSERIKALLLDTRKREENLVRINKRPEKIHLHIAF